MIYLLDARTATPHFPGIGRYVANLAGALPPLLDENEHLRILHGPFARERWRNLAEAPNVSAVEMGATSFSLSQQWRVPRLLKEMDGPIYHSTYYLMPYRPGVPTVVTIYDLIAMLHPQTVSARARLLFRVTTRLALRAAQQVITISQASRTDLLAHFGVDPARVRAIPLAPDPRFTPRPPHEIEAVRDRYELPVEYLLFLGINKPHKNLVRLINAYAQIGNEETPPLVIAGAWDVRYPESKQRVKRLGLEGRVRFLGPVADEDLPALYSGAMVFLFPSLYEGFGLPPLEAMACGAPLLCSDRSSLPEVARDGGILFDPERVEEMADVMKRVLGDSEMRSRMRHSSLEVASRFSWRRTAEETLAVYRILRSNASKSSSSA